MSLAICPDGKFLRPPESARRSLVCVRASSGITVRNAADAGADAVVLTEPAPGELFKEARAAGMSVIRDAGLALGGALRPRPTDMWLLRDVPPLAARALGFGPGPLVASPVEDPRSGRCAGQVVFAGFDERSPHELASAVLGSQLSARRRPLAAEPAGGDGAGERLRVAADLGAGLLIAAEEDLAAIERLIAWERTRLAAAPRISVLVCAYNAEATLGECLASLARLTYPSFEVIVADDGSRDATREIAKRAGVRVLELEHRGLSAARNAAARAARGEIVAYLDADAAAHPDWLDWLWRGFDRLGADGVSGPNHPFADAGLQERAVSGAPGAPVPAVNPDGSATHLPGCSMAFRRELVVEIGFEEHLTSSSDDVVFCDAALARGARLFYHPTAAIDHHRRDTVAGYLRQQRAYGETIAGEAAGGHIGWDPELEEVPAHTPWRSRLNPFKRRYIFTGAQERGLYAQREYGARVAFPLRLAKLLAAGWGALLPAAWLTRRRGLWAGGALASFAALFLWVAALVPVFAPGRGPRALLQRLLTAALWFAQPVARALGERRTRRGRP